MLNSFKDTSPHSIQDPIMYSSSVVPTSEVCIPLHIGIIKR